jgi:mono/diheme cytochrome c family protein
MAIPRTMLVVLTLACSAALHAADGAEVFAQYCAPCHGLDGKARTPAGKKIGARDLSESKLADADIEKQILAGVKDPKGAERMPAFKDRLAAPEVAALVAFVKTFRR